MRFLIPHSSLGTSEQLPQEGKILEKYSASLGGRGGGGVGGGEEEEEETETVSLLDAQIAVKDP